jgi:hypothetical protein
LRRRLCCLVPTGDRVEQGRVERFGLGLDPPALAFRLGLEVACQAVDPRFDWHPLVAKDPPEGVLAGSGPQVARPCLPRLPVFFHSLPRTADDCPHRSISAVLGKPRRAPYASRVPDTDPFGEEKPRGFLFLARLFGGSAKKPRLRTTVRRTEVLDLVVPSDKVEAAKAALEQWLQGHGVATAVSVEPKEDGKSRVHAKLDVSDSAKLDLTSERIQSELEDVLANALH